MNNWIQNDNQNVDESINTPKLDNYYLFIGRLFIHNVTVLMLFISDDRVRLHVETSVVLVSSSLVFFCKFFTEDVY